MKDKPFKPPLTMLYAAMQNGIRELAADHGYALCIHGSMQKDFDLLAVPWVDEPSSPEVLVEAIRQSCAWLYTGDPVGPEKKPHGRLAWMIPCGLGTALDISIIPPTGDIPMKKNVKPESNCPMNSDLIVTDDMVERAAPIIYERMASDAGVLEKYPWQPWGNSNKQCEARVIASQVLIAALLQQFKSDDNHT